MRRNIRKPVRLLPSIGMGLVIVLCWMLTGASAISQTVIGGDITLTVVNPVDARLVPAPVVNNTTCNLRYASGNRTRKVTVRGAITRNHYQLTVEALNIPSVNRGVAQGSINVMDGATHDFIRDIQRWSGTTTCDLEYIATAAYTDGNSTENGGNTQVRVTYTQVNQ